MNLGTSYGISLLFILILEVHQEEWVTNQWNCCLPAQLGAVLSDETGFHLATKRDCPESGGAGGRVCWGIREMFSPPTDKGVIARSLS